MHKDNLDLRVLIGELEEDHKIVQIKMTEFNSRNETLKKENDRANQIISQLTSKLEVTEKDLFALQDKIQKESKKQYSDLVYDLEKFKKMA